jgi:inorganic triphosphatase YgiF
MMDAIVHQSSDALERELKFALEPGDAAKLKGHPLLALIEPDITSSISTYFDTPDHALGKAGLSLRLRAFEDHTVQTLKLPAAQSNGLFARGEFEIDVKGSLPDLDHLRQHCPPELRKNLDTSLSAVFRVEVQRTEWLVQWKYSTLSLVVDQGCIKTETRNEPLEEMEIEIETGRIEDAFDLARQLAATLALRLEVLSKADRGYRLTEAQRPQPEKAGAIKLSRKMTAAVGFQTVASLCIHHFAANERLFLEASAPEALHQMRVAIRRLRSLMSFFEDILPEGDIGTLRIEIGRLFKTLGAARDLDVLLEALRNVPETHASGALVEVSGERDAAYTRLTGLLKSPAFCLSMLDLLAFIECGTWVKAGAKARGTEKLPGRAALILKRQRKKMRKFNAASHLEAGKRHRLRIQAKKFRYACEFFGGLFTDSKASHRKREMAKMAEDLQDALGQLNDRVFMQEKLVQWAGVAGEPDAARHTEDEALEQNLIRAADKAQAQLCTEKRFWA